MGFFSNSARRNHIGANIGRRTHLIPGFHTVKEVLINGRIRVDELWISEGKDSARVKEILQIAREKSIPVLFKKVHILDNLLPGLAHQGIVALAKEFAYADLDTLINTSQNSSRHALLVAGDHITDEGNLGALIRTAVFFGAHGLILPKDRSAKVTQRVMKRSSGAYVHLPVARVVNLGRALDTLKKRGVWIIGTAIDSPESIYQFDWGRDLVLVMGSEGKGLSRSIKSRCHQVVSIPSEGHLGALNVSVACGVILSEIVHQRKS
ncbi:23S rRNA (guanosine(2251)-2'-O)-methyltransferase RlmB [Thermodesulfobacteriota bacterium]